MFCIQFSLGNALTIKYSLYILHSGFSGKSFDNLIGNFRKLKNLEGIVYSSKYLSVSVSIFITGVIIAPEVKASNTSFG